MPMPTSEIQTMIDKRIFANAVAVDISVTNHQFSRPACLYVGVTGNVVVDMAGVGTQVTLKGAIAGRVLPFFVTKVYKVSTTATDMLFVE